MTIVGINEERPDLLSPACSPRVVESQSRRTTLLRVAASGGIPKHSSHRRGRYPQADPAIFLQPRKEGSR